MNYYPNCEFNDGLSEKLSLPKGSSNKELKQQHKASVMEWKKIKSFIEERKKKIVKEMTSYLGSLYEVAITVRGRKISYNIKCPYRSCSYRGDRLDRHLITRRHSWSENTAKMYKSRQVRMYSFLANISHAAINKPLPCKECCCYYVRLDIHLLKKHQHTAKEVKLKMILARRQASEHNINIKKLHKSIRKKIIL